MQIEYMIERHMHCIKYSRFNIPNPYFMRFQTSSENLIEYIENKFQLEQKVSDTALKFDHAKC